VRVGLRLIALISLLAAPARAAFTNLGNGGRAPGMGDAFVAIADDVYAVYYNPAGLAQLERPQVSMSYSKHHVGLSDGSDLGTTELSYAHPLKKGRWGGLGTAYHRFALDSLYNESQLYVSWGKRVWRRPSGGQLLAGLSMKYLTRGFSAGDEASNAMNQLNATGQADPVLSGESGTSAIDIDAGFLYRFPRRFQVGLMIQHLNEPDVGFAGSDKLGRNVRLGLAYKSLWMNLTGEFRMDSAPDGSKDKDVVLAAERFFPTLTMGQFGVRSSLGFGSRQWKQLTMGFSYRINKIQADYGFVLPIGSVKGTVGTHRVALGFHFGAPTAEEEITQDLLLQAKRMRDGKGAGLGNEFNDTLRPRDLDDPDLRDVKLYVNNGEYRKAHRKLIEIAKELPPDEAMIRLSNRLALVAYFYPELTNPTVGWQTVLDRGIKHFLWARDRAAMLHASYALNIQPNNPQLDKFVTQMEDGVGVKADRLPTDHPRTYIAELLFRVEAAYNRGEHEKVLTINEDILMLEPNNVTALERVGSTFYVLKQYDQALATWQRALPLETNEREKRALMQYMNRARTELGLAPGAEPPPLKFKRQARPSLLKRELPRAKARRGDPRDIPRLYQKGVENYARGEMIQATALFMRILQIDPDNTDARKALDRIRRRR
jgi:tetratricopeptide (TPR) repeat protein